MAALGLALLSGTLLPDGLRAQAVGGLGGFLELSSVFFAESGRSFGPGEVITVSGAIPYIGGCLGQYGHGSLIPAGRGEGRFDPFPTADFYVVKDTGQPLGLLEKLNDDSGGVNRVIGLSSGAFIDETIAITKPAGNLDAGRYDVVMDQCLDGYFDPGIDIVLGEGAQFAFEVVLPGELPPLSLHATKESAAQYARALDGETVTVPGGGQLVVPGFCKRFNDWQDSAAIDAASTFGIWTGVARNKCVDLTKHYQGIKDDPPDANFAVFAELGAIGYHDAPASTPLERAMRTLAGTLSEQAASSKAILTTLERYQGAQLAGDDLYTVLQLEELEKHVRLMLDAGGSAIRFYAALESFDRALGQDPLGQSAPAQALRDSFPEMRRAIGGLIYPLGTRFERKVTGPGEEVLIPVGLRAWIEVYLGRNPFLPSLGLPGIPQVREFKGLPPLAFQHPNAVILGPVTAPPGRAMTLDATRSSDPNGDSLVFAWDLDGDGLFDDASGATVQHAFAEPATRLVAVKATDTAGNTDVGYQLVKIGDVNTQDIIATDATSLFRVASDGTFTTLTTAANVERALHVDASGEIWTMHRNFLDRYDASGTRLDRMTLAQFNALAPTPIFEFREFVLDGSGDVILVGTENLGPGQIEAPAGTYTPRAPLPGRTKLFRVPPDLSSVSFIADVHEPWALAMVDGVLTGLWCSPGSSAPGLAVDRSGDLIVSGVNGMNLSRSATGTWAVDPASGLIREIIPAGRATSSCPPYSVVDDPRFPPYFHTQIAVAGNALKQGYPNGGRSEGGIEVDAQGHFIIGAQGGLSSLRLYRVPTPPVLTFSPLPGFIAGEVLVDVFPTYMGPLQSAARLTFMDIAIDGSGDYLVGGDHAALGRGIFRIDPVGVLSKVSNAQGPFFAVRQLDVVPEIREVTPKDIPSPPSVSLSGLVVEQQGCPGEVALSATLTNGAPQPLETPTRVLFWNGDPGAGGSLLGSTVVSSLPTGGSAPAAFAWTNPPAGTSTVFVTTLGSRSLSRALFVCVPTPAPGSDAIALAPAAAAASIGASHSVTATFLDLHGRPLPGAPIAFEVTGVNPASGVAITNGTGVATFGYSGTRAGRDTILASVLGATSNDASVDWSGSADTTPPVLTLPAGLAAVATGPTGAPVSFAPTALDDVDGNVPVTCIPGSGATFPVGTTTVACAASDAAGNTTQGSFTVTTSVGVPRIAGTATGKGRDAAGNFYVDVRLANTGTGHARALRITQVPLRTLSGTGTVTLDSTLTAPLPIVVGALDVGAAETVRMYLTLPGTVTRFSVTESGTLANVLGTSYAYSTAQSVIP